jgi:hypothetical protein
MCLRYLRLHLNPLSHWTIEETQYAICDNHCKPIYGTWVVKRLIRTCSQHLAKCPQSPHQEGNVRAMKDPVGTDSVAVHRRVLTYSLKPILSYHRLQPEAPRRIFKVLMRGSREPPHASVSEEEKKPGRILLVIMFLVQTIVKLIKACILNLKSVCRMLLYKARSFSNNRLLHILQ